MPRASTQNWLVAFFALSGVLSLLPYRERALLPVPAGNEQGFLAQEISKRGPSEIVDNAISGQSESIGSTTGVAGPTGRASRLIPSQIGVGVGAPGVTSLAGLPAASTAGLPGAPGAANGGGVGGAGDQTGAGTGGAALAGNAPVPNNQVGQGQGNVNGPSGPVVLAGAAGELLAAVVPEPSTWAMFIAGIMAMGYGLRSRRWRSSDVTRDGNWA